MTESISPKKRAKKRTNHIKRNQKGGILIDKKDLKKLFGLLDESNKKYLTETDLRNRLSIFGPSSKEYKALMNNRSTINIDDLYNILVDNELTNFDPIQESFKTIFDPNDNGCLDISILKNILINFGYKKITDKDIQILIDVTDQDKDGKINLSDFTNIIKTADSLQSKLDNQ
eukprot:121010_1